MLSLLQVCQSLLLSCIRVHLAVVFTPGRLLMGTAIGWSGFAVAVYVTEVSPSEVHCRTLRLVSACHDVFDSTEGF